MRALVTGAAGFIGSHLCRYLLDQGFDVTGVDCFTDYYPRAIKEKNIEPLLKQPGFSPVEANVVSADLEALLGRTEVVFHLSAQAGVRASWGREFKEYTENNVLATQRLLEAAKTADLKRFIFASSSSVYGEAAELPMKESTALRPVSPYGVSKAAGEHLCHLYYLNFHVPTVCLRYFTVYGPRQRPDMAFHRFLKSIFLGEEIRIFGDGIQSRDFTYIDDILSGTLAALEGRPGTVYNLGGGHRIDLMSAIKRMERIIGRPAKVVKESMAKGDVWHTAADISAAREDLGYSPNSNLDEGLARELSWLKEVYNL